MASAARQVPRLVSLSRPALRPIAAHPIAGPSRHSSLGPIPSLRFIRYNSTISPGRSTQASTATSSSSSADTSNGIEPPKPGSQPSGQIKVEPRLSITFTCTANECGHRSTHEFSKKSYEHGIVLVQCPSCKNRHLIADHLGWFKESTESGKLKTVEDLLRSKGEVIRKGRVNFDGDIEYDGQS